MKDKKRKGTSQAGLVADPTRRRIIKGTAAGGALAGTGLITGFPYVHASEGITLRYTERMESRRSDLQGKGRSGYHD